MGTAIAAPRPLGSALRRVLWTVVAAGIGIRLTLAFSTVGLDFDIESFELVRAALRAEALDVYGSVNGDGQILRWPYPPGFFPWILASGWLAAATGLPLHGLIQVPAILADAGLALLVQHLLGRRGFPGRLRLTGAALVSLGPSFVLVSGYHGQIDSLAILPAVAALAVWERPPAFASRAVVAGVLIGTGAAIKTVPLLMVLALLPTARCWSERGVLIATSAALPILALAPFAASDPAAVADALRYSGVPGRGGSSLVVQPGLAEHWFGDFRFDLTSASRFLQRYDQLILGVPVLLAAGLALIRRVEPWTAAALLWLVLFAATPNWFPWYAIWALPFLLVAGRLASSAALQAALLVPSLLAYFATGRIDAPERLYVPIMIAVWAAFVVAAVLLARQLLGSRRSVPDGPGGGWADVLGGAAERR